MQLSAGTGARWVIHIFLMWQTHRKRNLCRKKVSPFQRYQWQIKPQDLEAEGVASGILVPLGSETKSAFQSLEWRKLGAEGRVEVWGPLTICALLKSPVKNPSPAARISSHTICGPLDWGVSGVFSTDLVWGENDLIPSKVSCSRKRQSKLTRTSTPIAHLNDSEPQDVCFSKQPRPQAQRATPDPRPPPPRGGAAVLRESGLQCACAGFGPYRDYKCVVCVLFRALLRAELLSSERRLGCRLALLVGRLSFRLRTTRYYSERATHGPSSWRWAALWASRLPAPIP